MTIKGTLLSVAVTLAVLIYLFPYTWMVLSAFRYPVDTPAVPPRFIFAISFDGFAKVFRTDFLPYLVNSVFVTTLSVAMTVLIATPAAYALIRIQRGRTYF